MIREIASESGTRLAKQNPRQVDRQLIVKLKKEFATDQEVRRRVFDLLPEESTMARDFDELGLAVFDLPKNAEPSVVAPVVETDSAVEYAEPNFIDAGAKLSQQVLFKLTLVRCSREWEIRENHQQLKA